MDTLDATLAAVMAGYAGRDLNGDSFLTHNEDRTMMTVVSVADLRGQHFAGTSLAAHIAEGQVVIDHDINDRPLVDALIAAGVPRAQIVLAYAGESVTHAA